MEALIGAQELASTGYFVDALRVLDGASGHRDDRLVADTLKAELLQRVGRHEQSRTLAEHLLKSRELKPTQRSICEAVLAKIDWEKGNTDASIARLLRSVSLASEAGDLERTCWSQMSLLEALGDRSGPDAVRPLLAELRTNAIRLGHPHVVAALHTFVGQTDAKRGLFHSAIRHSRLAQRALSRAPNIWLEGFVENTFFAIAVLRSDFDAGLVHGLRVLQLTDKSGAAASRRACLGNLGSLYHLTGQFAKALDYHDQAISALPSFGDKYHATIDALAQIHLTEGRIDDCRRLLDRIDGAIQVPEDRVLWAHRYALLTRTQLFARENRLNDALASVGQLISLAANAGDHLLSAIAVLTQAEILQQSDQIPEAMALLDVIVRGGLAGYPADLQARYERVLACGLAAAGHLEAARSHFDRSKRIYNELRSIPGSLELTRCWNLATAKSLAESPAGLEERMSEQFVDAKVGCKHVLQSVAALMLHASRPKLLACEIVHVLAETESVTQVTALSRGQANDIEVLAAFSSTDDDRVTCEAPCRVAIGFARDRAVEILMTPKTDIESRATLNAITILLSTIHDLERARVEREEAGSLWPADDAPSDGGNAVVVGQMRDLMDLAKRIANVNLSVLLTGESGTGKEILARAIHTYSDRAERPFIPFNCTAVPREMLDSQLFGHRRGAFTGADRDNPGLIRTARDGTLFLDEIGEMSLDLQPKLLRFLESGEICPLGESRPFTVSVRVIAATNANIEQAAKDGRFRDDLFYRLNVVHLHIPPLRERRDEIPTLVNHFVARAAAEFKKGRLRVAEETMEHLLLFRWPGNVRQLHNEIRRVVAFAEPNSVLAPKHLSNDIANTRPAPRPAENGHEMVVPLTEKLGPTISRIEREMIQRALREHDGRVDAAARALGISRKGLYLKRQRLGL